MIGVVGGGIAGLATAYRLQQHGHDVQVFEAAAQLGGLAATYETRGDDIEQFYHHLSKSEETIVELADELGLGDRIEWRVGTNGYYVDGVVHPLDTPWEILAYPHMSLYDKFRLGMLTQGIDVRELVPDFDAYDDLSEYEHVTVREFVEEHTTKSVYENFVDPLLDGKYGDRKDDISAAWFLGRVRFRGERDLLRGEILGYFDGGFGVLLDALVDAVGRENITTDAPVTDLTVADGRVQSLTVESGDSDDAEAHQSGGGTVHDVDAAVVATMPNVLESLTGFHCDIDFQGAVCGLVTMEESLLDTYWLNVAHDAPFGALIEHTNFVERERYGGDHLLYVAAYVQDSEEELWRMGDDEVRETWLEEIESMFPAFDRSAVSAFRIARNPRAAPIYERGYLDLVVPYHLDEAVGAGVYYAGMASEAQYPERSLNGGVVAGYEVADRIDASLTADTGGETAESDFDFGSDE
ncbi:NAD(P)/FAD-dependent oxidoreductase [Halobellus litoreus]|uniref:NAD(P)/FAD-dependent oxidoreductase n=1 Tax=Halobellus litoreus TaxID=755310 RepID=A0ABD6DUM7_9EURY|nr:NAD(P)/FAD-dependent oxidoreductase [Halobellus litoreus]